MNQFMIDFEVNLGDVKALLHVSGHISHRQRQLVENRKTRRT
jgi:hypothetical protein